MHTHTTAHWRTLALSLLSAGLLAACAGTPSYTLTVLHTNDHHSNLESKSKTLQLDTGAAGAQAVTVQAGGFARVTSAMQELALVSPNPLKLHAGDALTGTLYFNRAGAVGQADAALMNTVCFDAFTLGNHEFDKGDTALKGFLDMLQGGCPTVALSANTHFGPSSALGPQHGGGRVQASTVLERGGQRIGLVGVTVAKKTKASSSPDLDTTFEDEAQAAQREIDRLRASGIDKIILLSHVGYERDLQLAEQLDGVDAIVGGDSHSLLGPDSLRHYGVGTPVGPYPTRVRNRAGHTVCVVQAWEYAQVVGQLQLRFDGQGQIEDCDGTAHVLVGEPFTLGGQPATAAQTAAVRADMVASGFLRPTTPSPQAAAALAPYQAKVAGFSQTQVADAPQELCARRTPGGPGSADYGRSSSACNAEGRVNQHGGDIQQLVAHAYWEIANAQYGGADIALQNAGGVRTALQGTITAAQVIQVLPFANTLHRLDLRGSEVKAMLEDGLEAVYGPNASTGAYPYTGGLRFAVDAAAPKGQRASQLEVRSPTSGTWQTLEPDKMYRLFAIAFNARGGDGYHTLATIPAERRMDIGVLDADAFFSYLDKQPRAAGSNLPVLRRLPAEFYSTQRFQGDGANR